jgi:hypothetical protein
MIKEGQEEQRKKYDEWLENVSILNELKYKNNG